MKLKISKDLSKDIEHNKLRYTVKCVEELKSSQIACSSVDIILCVADSYGFSDPD